MSTKLLRMKQLLEMIPVSRSTMYQWIKDNKFPKSSLLLGSSRCAVWKESDVKEWLDRES